MYRKYFKRTFDTSVALIVLIFTMPLTLVVVACIRLDSKGSVFFKQKRTGLNGRDFYMYKFRTMVAGNNVYDTESENQATKVGAVIKALSLDELPQLMNILRGHMSLIGPRPWIPEYYKNMTEKQRTRASVRPGVSGLAQARGRNNLSIYDKINYDLLYAQNITFVNDIKIIILTIMALFEKSGVAIEKFGIHQEIEILSLQHRVVASTSAPAFYAELPKAGKPVDRISRSDKSTAVKTKKVLFTATVDSHILAFHLPYLKYFKDNGYEVHVATNGTEEIPHTDVKHTVSFERSPLKPGNIKAILSLKKIIDEEKFDIIHTHTPMGSVVTRIAAIRARKKHGTRVIYTAHGFHFFKGAPTLNWIIFYPIEKTLARFTDTLITINKEDYDLANQKFKSDVRYIPGVGIDPVKFPSGMSKTDKQALRKSLGLSSTDFVLIYPAELSKRKRQIWLIEALQPLIKENKRIHLLLPGKDSLIGACQQVAVELGLDSNVHFLGFRKDIPKLLSISDVAVSAARQEGLPVNIMEAMYVGLPVVVSDCRGNRDLVDHGRSGFIFATDDKDALVSKITELSQYPYISNRLVGYGQEDIKNYMLNKVLSSMDEIYRKDNLVL